VSKSLKLWMWGAAGGLLFGVGYWKLWGCWNCARTWGPTLVIAFCIAMGGLIASMIGKDLLRSR